MEVSVAWKIHYQLMLFVRKPRRKKTEALDLDANISSEGTQEPPLVNDAHSYPPDGMHLFDLNKGLTLKSIHQP